MIWELIRLNKRKSAFLILVMGVLLLLLGYVVGHALFPPDGGFIGVVIAFIIWLIQVLVAMNSGSQILLSASHARKITEDVHPRLFHVVEEMRLAANLPAMPEVYIIETEAPNAFATGKSPEKSAVAVTAGLLSRLNRDELQGVVAHEMSHIANRDIRYMTFAAVMLGSIVIISEIFLRGMFYSSGSRYRSSKGSGQGQLIIMVVAIVLAILAPLAAQLFYFSLSRKREYLADASAARLTRYPEGLASALEKIADNSAEIASASKVTAPLYIVNPLKAKGRKVSDLTSTHPPISERIRILRAMAGNAGFASYQEAFSSVKGTRSRIIPGSALAATDEAGMREMVSEAGISPDARSFKRSAGDIIMAANGYRFLNCSCGLKIKIPAEYRESTITCPRCGRIHEVK
jgi:heat shock protein HtpX